MYLQSIASAFPETRHTQSECWEFVRKSGALDRLQRRSGKILEAVLLGDSGIDTRHFAVPADQLFSMDAEALNKAFEAAAPPIGIAALESACAKNGTQPSDIDALIVCTCTGYLCPGVSSYIAEGLDLRPDTVLHDLTGLGCGAAIPALRSADALLASNPNALVATVAVEVCSAAFYLDDDRGVLVSACLFGDGASAALWRADNSGDQWKVNQFHSLHRPEHREKIRFTNAEGKLRNQLDKAVPSVAAGAVEDLFKLRTRNPDQMLTHTGGRDVIEALEERFPDYKLTETRDVLRKFGNLSSPSILLSLEERFANTNNAPEHLWLTAFGAGFAAHSCEVSR